MLVDRGAFCFTGLENVRLAPSSRAATLLSAEGDGNPFILWNAEIAAEMVAKTAEVRCSDLNARYRSTVLDEAERELSSRAAAQSWNFLNSAEYFFHVDGALDAFMSSLAFMSRYCRESERIKNPLNLTSRIHDAHRTPS